MTAKDDRIGRLEALLERIRQRSAEPRATAELAPMEDVNGVAAGEVAAHWSAEDTETHVPVAYQLEELTAFGAPLAEPSLSSGHESSWTGDPPPSAEPSDNEQEEHDSFQASMLDEYEVSDDVVEINVDTDDDSVRTSVHAPMFEPASPASPASSASSASPDSTASFEVPRVEGLLLDEASRHEAPPPVEAFPPVEGPSYDATVHADDVPTVSGARLAGASDVGISDGEEMLVAESELVQDEAREERQEQQEEEEEDRGDYVTVDVDEVEESVAPLAASDEPPASSRRPIAVLEMMSPEDELSSPLADLPSPLPDAPVERPSSEEEPPPFTPPPASGRQIAAEYTFDAAPPTLHPVAPLEPQGIEEPLELDAPRQIWKATSPPPQVEPESFGSWLDATLSL